MVRAWARTLDDRPRQTGWLLSNQRPGTAPRRGYGWSVSTESFDARPQVGGPPYACIVHRRGPTSTIELEGELDLASHPTLEDAIGMALEPGPVTLVIIDMARVTFADSTTVTWLVHADGRSRASGCRLVTVVTPGPVRELLELTGLDERLTLVPDTALR